MLLTKYCSYYYSINTVLDGNCSKVRFGLFLDSMSKGSLRSTSSCRRYLSFSFSDFNLEEESKDLDKERLKYISDPEEGDAYNEIFNNDSENGYVPNKRTSMQMETSKVEYELGLDENLNLLEEEYCIENTPDSDTEFDEGISENKQHVTSALVLTRSNSASERQRAKPRNPRLGIGNTTLDDIAKKIEDSIKRTESEKKEFGSKSSSLFTTEERACFKRTKPDLKKIHTEKWPFLHLLVTSGQEYYLDRYLKQGGDVNVIDKDGYSALQRAIIAKKEAAAKMLLREGADVTICDKDGASLLHYGVQTGSMSLVSSLISCGVDVNSSDMNGWTALHLAVLSGRADIVQLLLVSGADKTVVNKDGLTPLDLCLSLGRVFNSTDIAIRLKTLPKKTVSAKL